jgi:hypothetical protein
MKTQSYKRGSVIHYTELPTSEQEFWSGDEESSFVPEPNTEDGWLPLSMFIRTKSKIWHGVYGMTYNSGFFVCLSSCGTEAVVASKYS